MTDSEIEEGLLVCKGAGSGPKEWLAFLEYARTALPAALAELKAARAEIAALKASPAPAPLILPFNTILPVDPEADRRVDEFLAQDNPEGAGNMPDDWKLDLSGTHVRLVAQK